MYFTSYFHMFKYMVSCSRYFTVWITYQPLLVHLLYASTCFEHSILKIWRSKFYYTAPVIITNVGGRPVHRLREDCARDGYLQVWQYQMLYNTILTSRCWENCAPNMYSSIIYYYKKIFSLNRLNTNIIHRRTVS